MRLLIPTMVSLVLAHASLGQAGNNPENQGYVQLVMTDRGPTSELLPMPLGRTSNLTGADVAIKYFGPQSDSDLSLILILKGTRGRYSAASALGVKFYSDDVDLNVNSYRMVNSVSRAPGEEGLHVSITTEELAWMAGGGSLKIETFNTDSGRMYDILVFTASGLGELKRFARSVSLIRSYR